MTLEQATAARLLEIRDIARSGVTEYTGTARRDSSGAIVGRISGLKPAFPELQKIKDSPKSIADAIEQGRGPVFERVESVVEEAMLRAGFEAKKPRSCGVKSVSPHDGKSYCKHCREFHCKGQHRFHGAGSFHQTHLFSFNPMKMKNPRRGRAFYFLGSYTSKILAARAEREHPGSFIHFQNGRWYVLKPRKVKNNPSRNFLVTIYRRVLSIQAQKMGYHRHCDAECKRVNHKYIHDFKRGATLSGIPDGSFLMLADGRTIRLSNGSMLVSDKEY